MSTTADPTLHALMAAAVQATGATRGWLLENLGAVGLRVVGSAGSASTEIGTIVPAELGATGLVIASGQPVALAPSSSDRTLDDDLEALAGAAPRSLICVPCITDDDTPGVLALIDKQPDGSFSLDDVEIAMLFADVAAAALQAHDPANNAVAPAELARELEQLAIQAPDRYRTVAALIEALLAG